MACVFLWYVLSVIPSELKGIGFGVDGKRPEENYHVGLLFWPGSLSVGVEPALYKVQQTCTGVTPSPGLTTPHFGSRPLSVMLLCPAIEAGDRR